MCITSLKNPLVDHLLQLKQDKKYRRAQNLMLYTGLKSILEHKRMVKRIFCLENFDASAFSGFEVVRVSAQIIAKVSGLVKPEGVMAEMQLPKFTTLAGLSKILVLDGVSDPGNMGTLLRTAIAFNWQGVFFLPGGCDPFNEKVIRSAKGAHFDILISEGSAAELGQLIQQEKLTPVVADLSGSSINDFLSVKKMALVLGNEAHGPSSEIKTLCQKVSIEMSPLMESLNVAVAGSILLYLYR